MKERGKNRRRERSVWLVIFSIVAVMAIAFFVYAGVSGLFSADRAPDTVPVAIPDGTETAPESPPSLPDEAPADVVTPEPPQTPLDARDEIPIGTQVGQRAPEFTLESLDGDPVSLSSYRGQVVILDFWASWCSPCRASMPTLHSLWKSVADQGVVMIGVSLDRTAGDARTFLKNYGYADMIALYQSPSAAQAVARQYGVLGIPRTLVIDQEGVIRFSDHPARLTSSLLTSLL